MENQYLYCPDKNYHHFLQIKDFCNQFNYRFQKYNQSIKKNMSLQKNIYKRQVSFSPNTDSFLVFFIVFEQSRIFRSAVDKQELKSKLRSRFFCEHSCTINCNLKKIFKKSAISDKIVSFFKFVSKIHQLVRKCSQKNNQEVIVHYISLPNYQLHFPKFCLIQKQ